MAYEPRRLLIGDVICIPYARHYNPRFVFFYPIFHCGLFCRAVYTSQRFILQSGQYFMTLHLCEIWTAAAKPQTDFCPGIFCLNEKVGFQKTKPTQSKTFKTQTYNKNGLSFFDFKLLLTNLPMEGIGLWKKKIPYWHYLHLEETM